MNTHLLGKYCRQTTALLGAVWLALVGLPHFAAAQGPPTALAATAYPVLINASGHLTDLFFIAGEYVRQGQVLAKVERPDGSPYYISAPVAGRITASQLTLDGHYLPIHTLLATVKVRCRPAVVCR
jgi:hypothetical protein